MTKEFGTWNSELDAGQIMDGKDLFPLRRQANPPTGVIKKEPVPQLREG